LAQNSEGIVAWTKPKVVVDGEWVRVAYTGYFEDINKVKIYEELQYRDRTTRYLAFACEYIKGKRTSTLTFVDETWKKLEPYFEYKFPQQKCVTTADIDYRKGLQEMLEGMVIKVSVTVPGRIQESKGFISTKSHTGSYYMNDKMRNALVDHLFTRRETRPYRETMKLIKEVTKAKEARIIFKNGKVSGKKMQAFKKEMTEAKEAWEKLLKESPAENDGT
jgi:hypothetical protein